MMFDAVTTMAEQAKSGKVKALATSGKSRSDVLPDVPTLEEAGLPGYEATIWLGIMAPKGTPADVISKLNAAIAKMVSSTEVRQVWARQGAVPMTMAPAEFNNYIQADITKWERVIQSAGIKAD